MSKHKGYITMRVMTECPHCEDWFDLLEVDEPDYITNIIFTNTTEACTNLDYEVTCPHCEEDYILDEFEW